MNPTEKLIKRLKEHLTDSKRGELTKISKDTGISLGNLSKLSNDELKDILYNTGKKIEDYLN